MRTGFGGQMLVRNSIAWVGLALGMTVAAAAQMPEGMGNGPGAFAGGQMVRGTVTAVTADKITVKTDTGDVYQVSLSANTRLMKARAAVKATDIRAGDAVGAMGVLDAPTKTVHAVFVTVVDADDLKKAREAMGKTMIAGKITAMDEVKLTILRTDGVSQVIEVDENTSFKRGGRGMAAMLNGGVVTMGGGGDAAAGRSGARAGAGGAGGGESITLADVKVGDTVVGQGALKHGVFVPTQLGVSDAAAAGAGQRRRRPNGDGAPAGAGAPADAGAPSDTGSPAGTAAPSGAAPQV